MKLVKIFGMVLALHVVLLTIFFLSPGCQSTPKNPPAAMAEPEPEPVTEVAPATENWSSQDATSAAPSPYSPSSLSPITGPTPAERARTSPTRPEDPSSFISTPESGSSLLPPGTQPPAPSVPSTYTVVAGDSLWKISRKFGITVPELQKVNAGLNANSLRPGDVINIPEGADVVSTAPATTTTQSVTSSAATGTYVVKSGDSLSKIAARNGTTISALRAANNLSSDVLQIGQKLVIPEASAQPQARSSAAPKPEGVSVVIQSGETLGELAARFDVTVAELMRANNITDPRRVRAGQTLVIPGFQAVDSTPAAPIVVPRSERPATGRQTAPAPETTPTPSEPVETTPPPVDLDALIPADAPIVPIDEPVPTP